MFLAEPVMVGLEGALSGSEVNLNCLLCGGSHACSCPCVSGPIPRRQFYSASKLVYKGRCLEATAPSLMVDLRVSDWTLVNPAVIPRSSADSPVGVRIVGCHIKILIGRHDSLLRQRYDFRSKGGVRPCP